MVIIMKETNNKTVSRDTEFEEALGDYLTSAVQTEKYKKRLASFLHKESSHSYKFGSKYYKVDLKMDEVTVEELRPENERQQDTCGSKGARSRT